MTARKASPDAITAGFVDRVRRERTEQGLPETIAGRATLRIIASTVAANRTAGDAA